MTDPGAPDKGFKVDTDKLSAIADKIQALADDIQGQNGYVPGSLAELTNASDISQGLAPFWTEHKDIFAEAYQDEYKALAGTYNIISQQLSSLHTVVSQTATGYGGTDSDLASQLQKLINGGGQ